MKKILSLMLAMVLVLSLAACGGGAKSENNGKEKGGESVEEAVIGDWTGDYVYNGISIGDHSFDAGQSVTTTLNIFKGGTIQFMLHNNETNSEMDFNGKWEISDDVLVITYTAWENEETCGF